MRLLSYPFMYFITESAAVECGCILGGIVSYMVWCCMTLFRECVSICLHWHLHRQSEGHLTVWSLKYFHGVALEWSHLLDCTNVWFWICVVVKKQNTCTECKRDIQVDCSCTLNIHLCVCFLCFVLGFFSDALQKLQAEVSRLQERLESCLRNKTRPSSMRAATSTQEKHPLHRTSTPCVRLVSIFWV